MKTTRHPSKFSSSFKCLLITAIIMFFSSTGVDAIQAFEKALINAVDRVEPSVVNVKAIWTSQGVVREGMGSGVIISNQGWIITNSHVIRNANKIFVTLSDGRVLEAGSWRADPVEDIAVIKVSADNLRAASIGNSTNLRKGQIVIAIGNPWRFNSTVTMGCISGTGRSIAGTGSSARYSDLIQTDTAINPGNSGGALANTSGEVIGINTLVYTGSSGHTAQGMSFSIPINQAMETARRLISVREGVQLKAWLGVQVVNVTPQMNLPVNQGVVVVRFPPNSPAEEAGLRPGDVILRINQVPINNVNEMQRVIHNFKPGDRVTLEVLRGGKRYQAQVKLEGMRQ